MTCEVSPADASRLAALVWAFAIPCWLALGADVMGPTLDTIRLLGKAYYENDDFKAAAEQYRRAVERAPDSARDQFNLGLVLMRAGDYTNALLALDRAEQIDPRLLAPHYLRGIIFKRLGEFARAIASLKLVLASDPPCVGAGYNLAMCHKAIEQYPQAIAALQAVLKHDPNNPSCHYQLITLYRQLGDVEQAARHTEIFDRVKDTLDESEKTAEALERSPYSSILVLEAPVTVPDLANLARFEARFVDVTASAGLEPVPPPNLPRPPATSFPRRADFSADCIRHYLAWTGGAVAPVDYDQDGRMDFYVVDSGAREGASGNRLYHNDGAWRFSEATAKAGVGDRHPGAQAVWGDFDNDGRPDLYVVNFGPNSLYHNRGDGTFEEISEQAGVNDPQFGSRAVFVDYDHDNDLDLLVANNLDLNDPPKRDGFSMPDDFPGQFNSVLRNNGNRTFADQTDEAGLLVGASQSRDLVCADFDGDSDVDLFLANYDVPSLLFLNARQGKFASGGSFHPPIQRHARAAAESDFNRDGRPDVLVHAGKQLLLYTNNGHAHFTLSVDLRRFLAPLADATPPASQAEAIAGGRVEVADLNNDGWLDVVLTDTPGGEIRLLAGAGAAGQFRDVTVAAGLNAVAGPIAGLAACDLDNDGDLDLVVLPVGSGARLLRNEGGHRGAWIALRLRGRKVNRGGLGAVVEVAASGHYQRQTVRSDRPHFGLGDLAQLPVLRVTWPNGMAQNIVQPAIHRILDIEEYVRVSASCAFLWADGGCGYQLVNEILGIGPLGVPMSASQLFPADCTELTKIESHQLVARDGRFELRLTEDLREVAYVDQIVLRVVDHPAHLEIVPNEMFTSPPFPEDKFFAVPKRGLPRSAVDDRGKNVLGLIREHDGRYPTFPLTPHEGLAQPHSLVLDLGELADAPQVMLGLDGWIYWADSSVSWGVFQNTNLSLTPLKLEVRDPDGRWRTAIESVGLPTSKGSVVPVDLTGQFRGPDHHVRLSTTLCVYFDRIFVATADEASRCRVTALPVIEADLHFRGFTQMLRNSFGYERFAYQKVSPTGAWNPPRGWLTRFGEVTGLLASPDDRYVIMAPGDELTMHFDAEKVPGLPEGWKRSYILYANGWVKDGDLNTVHSETIEPLPFHGMSAYPYPATERYPDDPEHRDYLRQYQTRRSQPTVADLTRYPK